MLGTCARRTDHPARGFPVSFFSDPEPMIDVLFLAGLVALVAALVVRRRAPRAFRPLLYGGGALLVGWLTLALTVHREETASAFMEGFNDGHAAASEMVEDEE